ncbi:MAG: VOC family protein [Deltaproteobacteria bacterium]|nr:VOC family protein [Deltaproteobacteria bacterium]MBT6434486.1 VOC family protein [Deltaproteobacteria bacterium]MBT6491609.1 VOC family protein [Deltaproteobacteria bacterium]
MSLDAFDKLQPFHLAIPVLDLEATRAFYVDFLGSKQGRSAPRWIDFNFFGHQVSVHLVDEDENFVVPTNGVDGDRVPARHFGVVLTWSDWQKLSSRLVQENTDFLIAPKIRFEGEPGEQGTFFLLDPSGNALEFKSFKEPERLFAT